jgi:uncharacterized protein YdaU (DUF1376 family)
MKSPAFQFYPSEYTSSQRVRLMTLEEEGAYINLLCSCWLHGSIPADPQIAARLIGKGASTTLATKVLEMFTPSGDSGRLVHERLERERIKQADWREKSASGGKKSAEMRKGGSRVVEGWLANGTNQNATLQSSVFSLQSSKDNTSLALPATPSANEVAVESIWALYPKKTGKKAATREIITAIRAKGAARIRERVQAYAAAVAQWPEDERKFVPDPVRWFKRGNYDDDPQTWQRKSANGVPQLEAHLNVF